MIEIFTVLAIGILVLGAFLLHGTNERAVDLDRALKERSQDASRLEKELSATRQQLLAATSVQRERDLKFGSKGLSLLSWIVWNDPWARNASGAIMCFYCEQVERPDHTVEHRKECRFIEAEKLLADFDEEIKAGR